LECIEEMLIIDKVKEGVMDNIVLVSNGYLVTEEELQDFVSDIIEIGIGYWATIDKSRQPDFWDGYDSNVEYASEYAYGKMKEGVALKLIDREDGEEFFVTLDAIKKALSEQTRFDFENYDADDCDWVMQMAMFCEVIYG
jgi:hypothetical protein